MYLSRALSALLAASVLTACATSAAAPSRKPASTPSRTPVPESTAAPPLSDARIANRGLLQRTDFPPSWKVVTAKRDRIKCATTAAARKAASARGRPTTFISGENTQAESATYVYRRTGSAVRQFKPLSGSATTGCFVRAFKRLYAKTGLTPGTITTAPLPLEAAGDERAGTRITIPVTGKGVNAQVLVDIVVVRIGRTIALGLFADAVNPFDGQFRAKLTATQVRRLRDAQLH
jgi:hypothetical protein